MKHHYNDKVPLDKIPSLVSFTLPPRPHKCHINITFYYTIPPHTLCHQSFVYPKHFLNTTSTSAIRATRTATAAFQTFRVLHQHEVPHLTAQLNNQSRKILHLLIFTAQRLRPQEVPHG